MTQAAFAARALGPAAIVAGTHSVCFRVPAGVSAVMLHAPAWL